MSDYLDIEIVFIQLGSQRSRIDGTVTFEITLHALHLIGEN